MEKILPMARQLSRANWLAPLAVLLTLAILAATISLDTARIRGEVRSQIIEHDGKVMLAVARMEPIDGESPDDLARRLEDPIGQLALAFRLSKIKDGVLGVRLFDRHGKSIIAVPSNVQGADLTPEEMSALSQLRTLSHYEPAAELNKFFLLPSDASSSDSRKVPLHLVLIPIHAPGKADLLAAAQLVLDGHGMAHEFARLDRKLLQRAVAGFLLAGVILAAALVWVFRRLQQINRRLHEQASSLRRANQELALAVKTSAVGAVTMHLMHGLASPFTGLHNYVAAHAADDAESQDALRSAQRMQAMIEETVRLLNDGNGGIHYELPLTEMAEILSARTHAFATTAGVRCESFLLTEATLSNRTANLVALILENLLRNAIQATPAGKTVALTIKRNQSGLVCEVADQGGGLSDVRGHDLFAPCRSTKPGGSGIGLAISQQLALHLGAELKLERSSPAGCVFALVLRDESFARPHAPERSPVAELVTSKEKNDYGL